MNMHGLFAEKEKEEDDDDFNEPKLSPAIGDALNAIIYLSRFLNSRRRENDCCLPCYTSLLRKFYGTVYLFIFKY